jgi:hypothetical protein
MRFSFIVLGLIGWFDVVHVVVDLRPLQDFISLLLTLCDLGLELQQIVVQALNGCRHYIINVNNGACITYLFDSHSHLGGQSALAPYFLLLMVVQNQQQQERISHGRVGSLDLSLSGFSTFLLPIA